MRSYLEFLRSKPDKSILAYRNEPTAGTLDWSQLRGIGSFDPDGLIKMLGRRKIAGVSGYSDEHFGVGRQLSVMAEGQDISYQPCLTEAVAIAWQEEEPDLCAAARISNTQKNNEPNPKS